MIPEKVADFLVENLVHDISVFTIFSHEFDNNKFFSHKFDNNKLKARKTK